MDKLDELKMRIYGAEVLRIMKNFYSYDVLSSLTGLSPQILSRYVTGHFLPSLDRAKNFVEVFKKRILKEALLRNIEVRDNVVVNIKLLSNARLLSQLAKVVAVEFMNLKVSVVLTKETDGIPLATFVAGELNARLVIAKQRKEVGVENFIEVKQVFPSGVYSYIYIPKELLPRGSNVLIVDDIIRSGSTVRALIEACNLMKAHVVGIYTILAIGEGIKRIEKDYKVPIKALLYLK